MHARALLQKKPSSWGMWSQSVVINTDTTGVYGNPVAGKLSTDTADGGVEPVIRYDVALGGSYTARIVAPSSFSSSPVLTDTVFWEGSSAVKEVSDTAMADYED